MARSGGMTYPKNIREQAELRKLPMITVEVNGKYAVSKKLRGRLTLQSVASTRLAGRTARIIYDALREMSERKKEAVHG